ncbi:MAG: orotidine-5'-phosphate decarboxylase [Candidatus Eisenbacteria bacterium]|nr:orotidine-5'-phosphate decarboxylase [Candidatus Eisenbacteria bacterium]
MDGKAEIALALDGMDDRRALEMVDLLRGRIGLYKVGLELFTRFGPGLVREISARGGGVFLDGKYHDIPSTVAGAVRSAAALDVRMLTLHGSGGEEMLRAAAGARGEAGTKLLAVTVLTSRSGPETAGEVERIALLSRETGMDGVVVSAREAERARSIGGERFLVVTPGIRPAGTPAHDQARTATPAEAVRAGADVLVIGRPITTAADPLRAAEAILEEMERAR